MLAIVRDERVNSSKKAINDMTADHNLTLLPLLLFKADAPFDIDLIYAQLGHDDNHFGALYHPEAQLLMHERLLPVVLLAARLLQGRNGWRLKVNDCFRPVEAQAKMAEFGLPPQLVMRPGTGGHPRGMAVDVEAVNTEGDLIPMGTPFDFFTHDLSQNPAARSWTDFGPPVMSAQIVANRQALDAAMFDAAAACGEQLIGYSEEWWDFRFPAAVSNEYPAFSDRDLPAALRMMEKPEQADASLMQIWAEKRLQIRSKLHDLAAIA